MSSLPTQPTSFSSRGSNSGRLNSASRPSQSHRLAARVSAPELVRCGVLQTLTQHMGALDDTEIRFLLLFCEPERSDGFCLSHSQLHRLTGRSSDSLSRAVARLVDRQWLQTFDVAGRLLLTPAQRRATQGRVVYRLAPSLLEQFDSDFVSQPSLPLTEADVASVFDVPETGSEPHTASANPRTASANPGTKREERSVKGGVSLLGREAPPSTPHLQSQPLPQIPEAAEVLDFDEEPVDADLLARCEAFQSRFEEAWRTRFEGETPPPASEADLPLLARRLKSRPDAFYLQALPLFFDSNHPETLRAYIEPRGFSLEAFLNSVFILVYGKKNLRKWE